MSTVPHSPLLAEAEFRFYEELNDFLPPALRKRAFAYAFQGTPAVKDAIEAIGVPHTEVDVVLVDGESVDFGRRLTGGERVAVYPVFERFDVAPVLRLRARPLRLTRFVLDVHLGRLARYLRLFGFDALYRNDYDDHTLIELSLDERRIILTRDKSLLKHGAITHGYWLRETEPLLQLREILHTFDLHASCRPFTRCMACNGALQKVDKATVLYSLRPRVRDCFEEFVRCLACGRIYWRGSHYERMQQLVRDIGAG